MDKPQKNIGWNGKTIKEMLQESEDLMRNTGYYAGLEKLSLKEENPIRYEKIFSRLRGGLVSARETSMNISASPIVKEEGELCFALYTPEGDSVAVSTGILVHVHTMSESIKYMIRNNFENDPGIAPGDIFTNNDTLVGQVHNGDVATMIPIFWGGELVGWAAGVTHEVDVGATSFIGQTDTYHEGLILPAMKIGQNDQIHSDYQRMCQRRVRSSVFWNLNERARVAGCHLIRNNVYRVIAQEGVETYRCFVREVIEDGRRSFLSRIKELLIPGTYRAASFMDAPFANEVRLPVRSRKDILMHGPLELNIGRDGKFRINMEGASAWGWHNFNCSPTAMQGAMWVLLSQSVIPNDKLNDGAYMATEINLPVGTWTNPPPIAATSFSWLWLVPSFTGLIRSLSRGFQARGFVEEVLSSYGTTGNSFQGTGMDNNGNAFGLTNFEHVCVGVGAGMIMDGLDFAAAMYNPEGDMGEVETWETIEPFLYLGRRVKPNTCGWGKYRGGSGFESLRMCCKIELCELVHVSESRVFCSAGLFGGYPSAVGYRHDFHDTDLLERAATGEPYPIREGTPDESELNPYVNGKEIIDKQGISLPEQFDEGDLYLSCLHGASGLGDPLERSPEMVIDDLNGEYITTRYAKNVYGVIAQKGDDDKWVIDEKRTAHQRKLIKRKRKRNSVAVSQWLDDTRDRILRKDFIEPVKEMYRSSMQLSESWAKEYRRFWNLPESFSYEEEK